MAFWTAFGSLAAAIVLIILTLIAMRSDQQIVLLFQISIFSSYYLVFGTGVGPQLGEAALGFLFFTASHLLVTWLQRRKSPLSAASSAYLDVESVLPVTSADSAAAATQPAQVSLHHSSASLLADGLRLLTEYTGAIVLACRRHVCKPCGLRLHISEHCAHRHYFLAAGFMSPLNRGSAVTFAVQCAWPASRVFPEAAHA